MTSVQVAKFSKPLQISILRDAVELDMATDDEASSLLLWKKYRVLLNRVDDSKTVEQEWSVKPL
ncbi:tail fiber assembly protein [Citrobacter sp. RHB35-C21]|nr:tail fiber assembly protein [Citrobacter sp. RHB35-C21]